MVQKKYFNLQKFVKVDQSVEAGKSPKEIGFQTSHLTLEFGTLFGC